MSNPLDTYMESKPETKTASFGRSFAGTALNPAALGQAAGTAAVAAGVGLAGAAAQKIWGAITKQRDFTAMMRYSPDLAEEQARNPDLFNRQYSSFRAINPQFAADPIIAGTYMRRMATSPEAAGAVIVESLNGRPKPNPEPAWMQAGMKKLPTGHELEMQGIERQKGRNALEEYSEMAPVRREKAQRALGHGHEEQFPE
jgi:hypothetical protein